MIVDEDCQDLVYALSMRRSFPGLRMSFDLENLGAMSMYLWRQHVSLANPKEWA
jgi:hypothetical protein